MNFTLHHKLKGLTIRSALISFHIKFTSKHHILKKQLGEKLVSADVNKLRF